MYKLVVKTVTLKCMGKILMHVKSRLIPMMMMKRITMGYYKNLVIEILELNEVGRSAEYIANSLGIAVLTVNNVLEMYGRPEGA
jgi:hypothetical protein